MKLKTLSLAFFTLLLFACGNETKTDSGNTDQESTTNSEIQNKSKNNEVEIIPKNTTIVDDINSTEINDIEDQIDSNMEENDIVEFAPSPSESFDEEIVEILAPNEFTTEESNEKDIDLRPDHSMWDNLLKENVSSSGIVNYSNLKNFRLKLNAYIRHLEEFIFQTGWSRNEKLAYWINLYNAATVRLIVENYPVNSITDINRGEPWDRKVVTIGNNIYTLNQIENDIIRPKYNEPRIHFAINCGAKSCPKLMNSAFIPDKLNSQLTEQTKAFINGYKNNIEVNKIAISKIFKWYADDFGASIIDYLNKYSTIKIEVGTTIEYKEYNWDLNN